ncbi:YraN family protein [Flavobacterium cerinum]|uniref:UPF0102 protein NOX80_02740 n=1 Tax=Flavobacterium cerinum TaxID=2502784 RepID=A0ABY5IXD1_9FLAO|nr:YraN family protein [Flavobacterium cerinum]UUC46131.1 YraN family protein [Flavobacterium cerinum]
MARHNELGKEGEERAVAFLIQNGYQILERNWMFCKAEIDIIAKKETTLVVVEVKTRSKLDFGSPQEFVKSKKIQLLLKAVNEYVILRNIECDVRFDIIAIHKDGMVFNIEHYADAFYYF